MTENFAPQSATAATHLGLVMLPALHNVLQSAGLRVITDEQFQVAAKKITESLKNAPFPVVVSNRGQSALLRTWTRNVTRLASRVVVVSLADGYTEFPDGVVILHTPVAVNEILEAAGYDSSPSLDGLVINANGELAEQSVVNGFDAFEEVTVQPVNIAPTHEPSSVVETFEDIPDKSDFATINEDFADLNFTFDIPDITTDVPSAPSEPVPAQTVSPLAEEEQPVTSTVVVPETVRRAAAAKHGDWVYEIDQYAHPVDFPPTAIVGAWWSDDSGNVDETSFQPNPHYVPSASPVFEPDAEPVPEIPRSAPFTFESPVIEPEQAVTEVDQQPVSAIPDMTFDELPEPQEFASLPVEEVAVETDTALNRFEEPAAPDLPEFRVPEEFEDDEILEPFVEAPIEIVAEPVAVAPVAVVSPEPVHVPAAIVIPSIIPTVTPLVTVSSEVPKSSDESLIAAPSNYRPLNDYIEPTSLTSGDNTFSMGAGDDSFLAIRNRPHGKGDVIFSWSGKGGVGKSTLAYSLAQRAATAGKRVVLIDGNFGQGDLRQYLRLTTADIPSVYDAAVSRNLKDAFIGPDTINQYRAAGLDDIKFVYVAAPPPHLADTSVVTPELYAAIIAEATHFADLIFVDTQIIETVDSTGMVDRLILPLMRERAWGVGVSDLSAPGIANTMRRLDNFAEDGVPATRQLTLLNRVPRTGGFNADKLAAALSRHSTYIGAVLDDENIHNQMNLGRTVSDSPGLAPLLDNVLSRIAGQQPPVVAYTSSPPPTKSKRRFFGKNR